MSGLAYSDKAPFAPGETLGEALLTPTSIYVKPILAALKASQGIKALAHITGGGFPENIPRVLPKSLGVRLDLASIEVPPVFRWLAATGPVAEDEMLRAFNCGIGMVVIASRSGSGAVRRAFEERGERVSHIGEVVEASGARVAYRGRLAL